jgi:hypothetical protein
MLAVQRTRFSDRDECESRSYLASRIKDLEKRLSELLRTPHPEEKVVKVTRTSLRDKYEQLILEHHEHACRLQCVQNLWRLIFYKRIEIFRKSMAKAKDSLLEVGKRARAEQVLGSQKANFSNFIDESKDFYLALISKLLRKCGVMLSSYSEPHGLNVAAPAGIVDMFDSKSRTTALLSCQRCLTYLGDLERWGMWLYVRDQKMCAEMRARNMTWASLYCMPLCHNMSVFVV